MPARELQKRLNSLREQLDRNVPLSEDELAALHEEARQIEAQLKLEEATPDNNLVDGVNLAIERFELTTQTLPPPCAALPTRCTAWVSDTARAASRPIRDKPAPQAIRCT